MKTAIKKYASSNKDPFRDQFYVYLFWFGLCSKFCFDQSKTGPRASRMIRASTANLQLQPKPMMRPRPIFPMSKQTAAIH